MDTGVVLVVFLGGLFGWYIGHIGHSILTPEYWLLLVLFELHAVAFRVGLR